MAAGQFGSWAPIGAEQTASGYEVAWKVAGADQYTVWNTDSSGNYLSNPIGVVSGNSCALESLETSFHQDLNGDGVIGPRHDGDRGVRIDQPGSGREQLFPVSGRRIVGPRAEVRRRARDGGSSSARGRRSARSRRRAAMRLPGRSPAPISIRSGTPTAAAITSRTPSARCRERAAALESLETSFQQDLNGDGVIGPLTTVIEASGIDQPGSGWEQLFPVSGRRIVGPRAELRRRGRDGGSVRRLDADRRGADGKRL